MSKRKKTRARRDLFLLAFCVPLLLSVLFLLPNSVKDQLILYKDAPRALALFTTNFVHVGSVHFLGNVCFYVLFVILAYILNLEAGQRSTFYAMATLMFLVLPFLLSGASTIVPTDRYLGFSGIAAGFMGSLPYSALIYLKERDNWNVEISRFLELIMFLTFGLIVVQYLDFTLPTLALLAVVWGAFIGTLAILLRDESFKASLSSLKYSAIRWSAIRYCVKRRW